MISFIRIDDRMIHGQTCTRWAIEYPCTGLIAVNDKAATNSVLKAAYTNAIPDKKTFVWTLAAWQEKKAKVLASKDQYFLITKDPIDMAKVLLDQPFDPGIKTIIVGPCNDRPGAIKLGNNQSIIPEEAAAFEKLMAAGYEIEFALVKETAIGNWKKFRGQFGYN